MQIFSKSKARRAALFLVAGVGLLILAGFSVLGRGEGARPLEFYGDSMTAGFPVKPAYPALLANSLKTTIHANNAGNGHDAMDQSRIPSQNMTAPLRNYIIMVGANDVGRNTDNNAVKRAATVNFLRSIIVRAASPDIKVSYIEGAFTYNGTWMSYGPGVAGNFTMEAGASATTSVKGGAVYIGYRSLAVKNKGGVFEVLIDGVSHGRIAVDGTKHGKSAGGQAFGIMAARFSGLGDGVHTVEVKNIKGTLMLEYVAGSTQAITPHVYVGNITPYVDANDVVESYNADISTALTQLQSDGLNVHLVDANAAVSGLIDSVHIDAPSHIAVAKAFADRIKAETKP